ncbi:MAG: Crp/Fnr family transcriptional regulator [Burkholderiales bacterium]|nr:Crp/Fnr family transcriptional regulator [Burkholderiales bacterium]
MPALQRFLGSGKWFRSLPPALQNAILTRSTLQFFSKGQVVTLEDSPPKGVYAVIRGRVHLVREIATGDEALVNVGEPGYWFGVFSTLTGQATLVTAVAQSPARLLFLPKSHVDQLIAEEPRYFAPLAKLALDRYAAMLRVVSECRDLAPERRARVRLAAISRMRAQDMPGAGPVPISVSQGDLARMVGISRQTMNQILARLRRDGLIRIGFRRISVVDVNRLAEPAPRRTSRDRQSSAQASRPISRLRGGRANW